MTKATHNEPTPSDTERRILEAAEKEFLAKGFDGARTTAIATQAGVNHAMLHYYFRTKERLYERILQEKIRLFSQVLLESLSKRDAAFHELLERMISVHLDFLASNPDLPRFIVGEMFRNPERSEIFIKHISALGKRLIQFIQERIDKEVEKGRCEPTDARMLLLDIASLNVFAFMAAPAVNAALDGYMENMADFIASRKKENLRTILYKLNFRP